MGKGQDIQLSLLSAHRHTRSETQQGTINIPCEGKHTHTHTHTLAARASCARRVYKIFWKAW